MGGGVGTSRVQILAFSHAKFRTRVVAASDVSQSLVVHPESPKSLLSPC